MTLFSSSQVRALQQIIGTIRQTKNFGEENYDTLITNTTKYAARLLKKQDQCGLVCECAHLFWTGDSRCANDEKVLQCLKRAVRIADAVLDPVAKAKLTVDILDKYLYFYDIECPKVEAKYLQAAVKMCQDNISEVDGDASGLGDIKSHFKNTVRCIKKKAKGEGSARYSGIELPGR